MEMMDIQPHPVVVATLVGFHFLTALIAYHAYKKGLRDVANLVVAFIFAYGIEAFAVYSGNYSYHYFLIWLPGDVPAYVIFGWALVFYAAYKVTTALSNDWKFIAVMSGLLATGLDLMFDPGTTGLGLWAWASELRLWYKVPLSNFFGWFLLLGSLAACNHLFEQRHQNRELAAFELVKEKLMVIFCGYLAFIAIFLPYSFLGSLGMDKSVEAQMIFHVLLVLIAAVYVVWQLPRLPGGQPLDWVALAVPVYLTLCGITYNVVLILVPREGWPGHITLLALIPYLSAAVIAGFYWPYRKSSTQ